MSVHRVKVLHDGEFYIGDWSGAQPVTRLLDAVTDAKRHYARQDRVDPIDVSIDATLVTRDVRNENDAEDE